MIHGADPDLKGSSFWGVGLHMLDGSNDPAPVMKLTFDYYVKRLKAGAHPVPHPTVMREIQIIAAKQNIDLDALAPIKIVQPIKVDNVRSLDNQQSRYDVKMEQINRNIKVLELQTTKKSKQKLRHNLRIRQEAELDHKNIIKK